MNIEQIFFKNEFLFLAWKKFAKAYKTSDKHTNKQTSKQ